MRKSHRSECRKAVLKLLAKHAYRQGDFVLKCGEKTTEIVDCSMLFRTQKELMLLSELLTKPLTGIRADGFGGPMSGADPIAVAAMLRIQRSYWCGVREKSKERGIDPGYIVGPVKAGNRVVVVEDVLTSGSSLIRAVVELRVAGEEASPS